MPGPSFVDRMQGGLPDGLKWIMAGIGAGGGFSYAIQHGSSVAISCIVAGAAFGFCLVALLFLGLRLLKWSGALLLILIVVNYAVLIPFGYGDHAAAWLAIGQGIFGAAASALLQLVETWMRGMR